MGDKLKALLKVLEKWVRSMPTYSATLSIVIYNSAFMNYTFGKASTASVYFLVLISFITFLQFRALRTDRVSY
ncbi:hypothetical protein [Paenibacillus sp. LHD-38]|uniref:hypothetical protein n=1 Tax=Paenibacillus sp. LHD-38 TaxID=3072143 RepID=UPI00280C5D9C|nr:hypothetical protein [Paenibacillus sp. LHD-38]MDQ8733806.1 hypothetical protein [Paenibacillus sp. LHD-38]